MEELAALGVYLAVSVSAPTARAPTGMLIVALLPAIDVAGETYVPLTRVTEPVGVALPAPPSTVIETGKADVETMLLADGVTVTAGVMRGTAVTFSEVIWETLLKFEELAASGV